MLYKPVFIVHVRGKGLFQGILEYKKRIASARKVGVAHA